MSEPSKVNNFDMFKLMCERNSQNIHLSNLENITEMRLTHKGKNTKITIGVVGDVLNPIGRGKMIGGMILCDKAEFESVKAELSRQGEQRDREGK